MLLFLLKEDDQYGYQLSQTIEQRSDGLFTIKESSMYPTLYRLQDKGLISSYQKQVGLRRARVYYHIEPKGEAYLESLYKEYLAQSRGIFKVMGITNLEEENQEHSL